MILVTGASGQLGGAILASLINSGHEAVGSSRAGGAPGRRIDFDQPATIDFSQVDTLVLVSAGEAEDDVVIARHDAAIAAAERDGVQHVIYTSVTTAGDHLAFALAHRWTERRLRNSSMSWTVLRNGLYAELFGSLLTWSPEGLLSAFGPGSLAAATRHDLADAAAIVAADAARHSSRTYDLVGTPVSAAAVAQRLGVAVVTTSLEDRRAELLGAGLKPFQPSMLMSIYTAVRHGFLAQGNDDLRTVLGRSVQDGTEAAANAVTLGRVVPALRG
ncbi:NAD-dependent epimerase/dehydratase family protein [Cryobacterium sp. N22]|uniref:NAD-dependent epimerase/dehydratase family protein n=1 Tax=Cryobacterium sp. N22 TaxID=2048290 RepID=UPI0018EB56AF|nr:NAD-dependent epimerase/dehydratase family protein [Cryobacterium sp. N22]